MKRWSRLILAVLFLCMGAAVAQPQTPARGRSVDDIIGSGVLRVGIDLANAPWGYLGADMQPTGIEYDVAALAAKAMGVKLEIVQVTAPGRIPVLVNGQADMMLGGFAIVATRALQVWLTIPFASGKTGVIAPASTRINTLEDLAGMKVGVVRGSTQDVTITDMAPKTANIVRFDDDAASIAALISGQVDATVAGAIVAKATRAKNPDKRIELKVTLRENPLGIGVQRGNIDLLLWLNTFIFNLKYDGTLAALHKKYDIDYGLPIF